MALGRPRDASLRWKLVLALVATSALTLAAAVTALVPPLRTRLEHDRLSALRAAARVEQVRLRLADADTLVAGSQRLVLVARRLQHDAGARVEIFDARGRVLVDSDPDEAIRTGPRATAQDALRARAGRNVNAVAGGQATVARTFPVNGRRYTLILHKQLNDTAAAIDLVQRGLPLAVGIGLLAAVLLALFLSRRLVNRLERLRLDARRLRDEGIAEPLAPDDTRDEVGEVARAVEAMRQRLVEDERGRQEFLGTAAHELRTPIASLQGTLELLEEDLAGADPDVARARSRAAAAGAQSRRLAQLTSDLLDLRRLDGELHLRHEPVELRELAGSVASEFEARAAGGGVTLSAVAEGPAVWALADAPATARIVRVLLDNALRYALGGQVDVTMGTAGRTAWLRVTDGGPGIPTAERDRIFERFERGAASDGAPGFGLGLSIGRELARRMGGDLTVLDVRQGASFALALPSAPVPALDASRRAGAGSSVGSGPAGAAHAS